MSQRLSTSATFQALGERVDALEESVPLAATLDNNTFLSAVTHNGTITRIAGLTQSDNLYFGGIDTALNSVVIAVGGSTSLELTSLGLAISGPANFSAHLDAPALVAMSGNGLGGTVKILGSGASGYTGVLQFHKTDGARSGYVGFNADAGPMQYGSDIGAGHNFAGGPILLDDANIGIGKVGADPVYMCDAGDYLTYSRGTDKFVFVIGGVAVASIDGSGNMRLKGTLTQSVTP